MGFGAGIIGGMVQGFTGLIAASKTASAMEEAALQAANTTLYMFNQMRDDMMPWLTAGMAALGSPTVLNEFSTIVTNMPVKEDYYKPVEKMRKEYTDSHPDWTPGEGEYKDVPYFEDEFDETAYLADVAKWEAQPETAKAHRVHDAAKVLLPDSGAPQEEIEKAMDLLVREGVMTQESRDKNFSEAYNDALYYLDESEYIDMSDPNSVFGMLERGPGDFIPSEIPGYEYGYETFVQDPITSKAAAGGRLFSGATEKDLTREAENYALGQYDNFLNRYYGKLNPLMATAGMGQMQSNALAGYGMGAAGDAAAYQYGGAVNAQNAWLSGFAGLSGVFNQMGNYIGDAIGQSDTTYTDPNVYYM